MDKFLCAESIHKLESFFPSRSELLDYLIMEIIRREDSIVGSLTLKIELDKLNVVVATATIGRSLKMLDAKGWTRSVSNKGRMLTAEGRAALAALNNRIERSMLSDEIVDSVEINHFDDLVNVLQARRIIEREAARLAAENATQEDFAGMQQMLEQHRMLLEKKLDDSRAGLDFHTLVVDAGKNRFLGAVERLLAYEEHRIESNFESLSVRNHALEYIGVHQELLNLLKERNADAACRLMEEHISAIIESVKQERNGKNGFTEF